MEFAAESEKVKERGEDKISGVVVEPQAEEDGEDAEEEEEEEGGDNTGGDGKKKKKKKKKNKKKKKAPSGTNPPMGRLLGGFTDYYTKYGQTEPPTIPVHELPMFKGGKFPEGQIMPHGVTRVPDEPRPLTGYLQRVGEAERRELDCSVDRDVLYNQARRAAECHRQTRAYAQSFIKPGIKLIDMCERLEETNRTLLKEAGLDAGPGFPTGCSINHVAAHYTPNCGDDTVLREDDVMKVTSTSAVVWCLNPNSNPDPNPNPNPNPIY